MRIGKLSVMGLLAAALAGNCLATEGGGGAYPNGAEGFMAGALPPPGVYFLDYMTYYRSDKFAGPDGDGVVPDFDLKAFANVFRLVYVTKEQVLGASYAVHAFLPIANVDVTVPNASENRWGVGDIILDPCILGWHTKNFHYTAGLDVYVPSGSYDATHLANASRGCWTFEPVLGATFLSDGGLDVSAKLMYDFNAENPDTDYRSGQEFHVDYSVAQKVGPVSLGVGGYYYRQTTKDTCDAAATPLSGKGRTLAVGPELKYDYKNMSLMLKYQFEMATENRPEGDKAWLTFLCAF